MQPLHKYLKGKNDKSVGVPTGTPLAVTMNATGNYTRLENSFTLGLYLNQETAVRIGCCSFSPAAVAQFFM